jgi:ADP-heptose:LPS heptosyltransferase
MINNEKKVEIMKNIAKSYENEKKYIEAIDYYRKALDILNIHNNNENLITMGILNNQIGVCYSALNDIESAIIYFKKVLETHCIPDVYTNIGISYIALKRYKDAEKYLLNSDNLKKNNVLTCSSLGSIYYYTQQYDKSIEYYNRIPLKYRDDTYKYNSSFPYLSKKDFVTGFKLYEIRLISNTICPQTGEITRAKIPLDIWNGRDRCSKLLIVYEQGLGDNIQYYRFIIELSEKYKDMKITFFCKKEIAHIFKTYGNIEIVDQLQSIEYDYMSYIMSLPNILKLTQITPNKINYIKTHSEKISLWKKRTSPLKKFRVGFVYNGRLSSFIEKYIELEKYKLLSELDIELICIHRKSEIIDDLKKISFKDKIIYYELDTDKPFDDTIHLLKNIDLLITVDTYIVHLAGIMNINTWLLLGVSEWRWSNDKHKTYWYDSVELIRSKDNEPLDTVLPIVRDKLIKYIDVQVDKHK